MTLTFAFGAILTLENSEYVLERLMVINLWL